MSSIKKRLSVGMVVAMAMGTAFGAANVYASSIGDSYATGDTLTATHMTNIKNAVNDNDGRITTNTNNITTLQTDVTNLKNGGAPSATCSGNNASDIMVRVGSICVDKYRASLYNGTSASATPTVISGNCDEEAAGTNCTNVVAQSRSSGTRATGVTVNWAQAARACANAGKRLLTPAEWVMAWQRSKAGLTDIADMSPGSATLEFVDSVQPPLTISGSTVSADTSDGRLRVGFMGESFDTNPPNGVFTLEYGFIKWSQTDPGFTGLGFRCAR
jgi:hypothetical protein